jgi:hypothetical protein
VPACEKGHAAPLVHVLVAQKWHAVAAADAGGAEAGAGPADAADTALLARCSKRHSSPFAQWPAAKKLQGAVARPAAASRRSGSLWRKRHAVPLAQRPLRK